MKALAARNGCELVDVGVEGMDAFMKEEIRLYTDAARKRGLGK
jgi:putative tricarboxylic transport membrane protein